MKKISFVFCTALLALGSCTSEINEEGFVDQTNAISFSPYSAKTRAYGDYTKGDVDIATMKDGSFGVVGYTHADNKLYLGSTTKAIEQYWKEDASISGGGSWEYKDPTEIKFWPADRMDFFAYFPYSANGATFKDPKPGEPRSTVMTINCESDDKDVLFCRVQERTQTDRVHMYFYHALSKIKSIEIVVDVADVNVTVSKVEVLNTSTKGKIEVGYDGIASYSNTTSDIRSFNIDPAKTITLSTTEAPVNGVLFDNSANGYLFATNQAEHNKVFGTSKAMWNGSKDALGGDNLSESDFVCLKLTCKVKVHESYHVGSETDYGEMYIPMCGIDDNSANITELLAGRRYTYRIVMKSNVGYKDNGDPIMLAPILFGVNKVESWDDVTVTINL